MDSQNKAEFFTIPSFSTAGKNYTVVLDVKGEWHCQCYPYLRKRTCKHIEAAKQKAIKDLDFQIEYLEDSIKTAEEYPTETAQFYNALSREKQKLSELKIKRKAYEL